MQNSGKPSRGGAFNRVDQALVDHFEFGGSVSGEIIEEAPKGSGEPLLGSLLVTRDCKHLLLITIPCNSPLGCGEVNSHNRLDSQHHSVPNLPDHFSLKQSELGGHAHLS